LLIDDIAGGFTFTGRGQTAGFPGAAAGGVQSFSTGGLTSWFAEWIFVGHAARCPDEDRSDRRYDGGFQRLLWRGIGLRSRVRASPAILTSELEVQKKES